MLSKVAATFAIGFGVAACIVQAQPKPETTPVAAAPAGQAEERGQVMVAEDGVLQIPDGAYACTIDKYNPFPCRVSTEPNGNKRLEKLGGSQRFSGIIQPGANGFSFRGTFYCPYGDCTEAVTGQFVAFDDGLYRGKLSTRTPLTVTIQYTEYGGYGANLYGGALYGGYLYGGDLYGYGYGYRRGYANPPPAPVRFDPRSWPQP